MNTLHLYHWRNIKLLNEKLDFISAQDSLLIFGDVPKIDLHKLTKTMKDNGINWYLVNEHHNPNIPKSVTDHEINHEQWLKLILQHKNTYAWK